MFASFFSWWREKRAPRTDAPLVPAIVYPEVNADVSVPCDEVESMVDVNIGSDRYVVPKIGGNNG